MRVENGDVNGDCCYMNSSTESVIRNNSFIEYTNKRDAISAKKYLKENNESPDGVDIDDILPASAPNQYANTK